MLYKSTTTSEVGLCAYKNSVLIFKKKLKYYASFNFKENVTIIVFEQLISSYGVSTIFKLANTEVRYNEKK